MGTAVTGLVAALGLVVGVASAAPVPVLGHPWAPFQKGYGKPYPVTISNGGDPTGLVENIRWSNWGKPMAIGDGFATYVWPGTGVSSNGPTRGARVVAFHLGTCRGRPSYDAVEWYFPKFDETFNPRQYINACTGRFVDASSPAVHHCRAVRIANSSRTATEIQATGMSCATARQLIAGMPVDRYLKSGGRFIRSGFRCGTEGVKVFESALFECELDRRELLYHVEI